MRSPSRLHASRRRLRGLRASARRDAEHRDRQLVRTEQPPQPPEAGARAIFVHRLHVHVALAGPGHRAEHVGQECLRLLVAMQDRAFAAFLIVDHELHRDARAPGPAWIRRVAPIADQIARVGRGHGWLLPHRNDGQCSQDGASWARQAASVERSWSVISVILPGGMAPRLHRPDLNETAVPSDLVGVVEPHIVRRRGDAGPDRLVRRDTCCSGRARCPPPL